MKKDSGAVWMAYIEVVPTVPQAAPYENAGGAFTNALALAGSAQAFKRRVRQDLKERGFRVIGFECPDAVEDLLAKGYNVQRKTLALARRSRSGEHVYYTTFEWYPKDERTGLRKRPRPPRQPGP